MPNCIWRDVETVLAMRTGVPSNPSFCYEGTIKVGTIQNIEDLGATIHFLILFDGSELDVNGTRALRENMGIVAPRVDPWVFLLRILN